MLGYGPILYIQISWWYNHSIREGKLYPGAVMARSLLLVMIIILTVLFALSFGNNFQRVSKSYDTDNVMEMIENLEAPAAGNWIQTYFSPRADALSDALIPISF